MDNYDLDQLVKVGTPTFFSDPHQTYSTLDLVFASPSLSARLIKCSTLPGHGSNHTAVCASFDISVDHRKAPPRRNLRDADWNEFPPRLEMHLAANPLPALPLSSRADIDSYTDTLTVNLGTSGSTGQPPATFFHPRNTNHPLPSDNYGTTPVPTAGPAPFWSNIGTFQNETVGRTTGSQGSTPPVANATCV
ncbi:hypothetical protein C8F04DRAFT_1201687 [Mycena alexandri]|uniref:Uncharacterized protein n=1 Tax=Mycena alexandri TaxID=1745969 RepID=A0AAD6RY28_9AGAR|nr:hypothetical protein C8F04DRAFT_1201687 [Mycena alexandri]